MDASKQNRSLCLASNVSRSIMTRSQYAASVADPSADISKYTFTKRKAQSPGKMSTKKPVFRDLTNRDTANDVPLGIIHDDSITAAAKKLANTKLHDQSSKKSSQLLRKVKVTNKSSSTQDESTINSFFKITKQPVRTVSRVPDPKAKKLDETKYKTGLKVRETSVSIFKLKSEPSKLPAVKEEIKENVRIKKEAEVPARTTSNSSQENESSSLYVTAVEDLSSESHDNSAVFESPKVEVAPPHELPAGVSDFDAENWNDSLQVSHYATDIFNYFKSLETKYQINDYMTSQTDITSGMRAVVVDWMVELQENFELNHETLYLAVKLVDSYLSARSVTKNMIQLVAAAAIFIASKYDERFPPSIEDTLYVCEGSYSKKQLLEMEISILKAVDFNLGFPISYRYLRRYARFGKIAMPTLTLARYILECSLMDYSFVPESDSKVAASALLLALKMKGAHEWTPNLEYCSGYRLEDLKPMTRRLNSMLHKVTNLSKLAAVKHKYSHKVFFEVTKISLINVLAF